MTLEKCIEGLAVPSKSYTYMASGRAILALMSGDTDIGMLVEKEEIGYRFTHGDVESLAEKILFLFKNPVVCAAMGEKARAVMERDFERKAVTSRFQALIKNLISRNGERRV